MRVIQDTKNNMFFKSFGLSGSLTYTEDFTEALDLYSLGYVSNESTVKRMIAAWYGKPFSKTGLQIVHKNIPEYDIL